MKRGADWFAWILQFILGLVVGAIFGFALLYLKFGARRGEESPVFKIAPDQVSTFVWGAALIIAGLASLFGDRLWMGSSYTSILPDGLTHSRLSRIISIVTIVLGGILFLSAIFRQ